MQLIQAIAGRRSVKQYDATGAITDDDLKALFEQVVLSPSSFNLQHWRFVVVRDPARKAELRQAAFGQEHVETASAVIVVVGKLDAHEDAEQIYAQAPQDVRERLLPMIGSFYADNPQARRDETIRSASLAAMTLMLAAYDMGYATCPMIGFDPEAVSRLVDLDDLHIPVMLVVVGTPAGDIRPRPQRRPVHDVVKLESLDGNGLA